MRNQIRKRRENEHGIVKKTRIKSYIVYIHNTRIILYAYISLSNLIVWLKIINIRECIIQRIQEKNNCNISKRIARKRRIRFVLDIQNI